MSELAATAVQQSVSRSSTVRAGSVLIGLSFFVLGAVAFMAAFGEFVVPQDPVLQNLSQTLAAPSAAHWLGTDALGRDVFSRLITGARSAVVGPLIIAAGSMIAGNVLGLIAGYRGGRVDAVIMRIMDLVWSVPALLVLIVVAGAFDGGYWLAVGLLVALTTPFDTRVVRGATLEQLPRPYVEAALTLGMPARQVMFREVWPNISPTVFANTFLVFASSLVALSGLSFLGLGVPPGTPDWGLMLAEGRPLLFTNAVASLAPGALLVLTATAMNLVGDWGYERLSARGSTR